MLHFIHVVSVDRRVEGFKATRLGVWVEVSPAVQRVLVAVPSMAPWFDSKDLGIVVVD